MVSWRITIRIISNIDGNVGRIPLILMLGTRVMEVSMKAIWKLQLKTQQDQAEVDALESNSTWELLTLPPEKKAIGCKLVYKTKYNSDDTVERHKARLVIYGNKQQEAVKNWELHQMDVHNTFLHGDLNEETKKQRTVSRSSAEVEYPSMDTTICELKWLKGLLHSLGVVHSGPMKLFCDSQAAIYILQQTPCSMNEQNTLRLIAISYVMKFSLKTLL
ncbi:retrovirus-related pol polyprotein from transposon TNT 1-94 [Tanacetum coccineum]